LLNKYYSFSWFNISFKSSFIIYTPVNCYPQTYPQMWISLAINKQKSAIELSTIQIKNVLKALFPYYFFNNIKNKKNYQQKNKK
jgi:hypothetical protein